MNAPRHRLETAETSAPHHYKSLALAAALGVEFGFLPKIITTAVEFGLNHPIADNKIIHAAETGLITGGVAGVVQGAIGALAIPALRESPFWQRQIRRQAGKIDPKKEMAQSRFRRSIVHFSTSAFGGPLFNLLREHVLQPDRTIRQDRMDVVRSTAEVTTSASIFIGSLAVIGLETAEPETINQVLNHPLTTVGLAVGFIASNADMISQAVKHRRGSETSL